MAIKSKKTKLARPTTKPSKKLAQKLKRVQKKTAKGTGVAAEKAKNLAVGEAPSNETPDRVTTETVAKHRKEVLSSSQRFIYPLTHSKHRVAIISTVIFLATVLTVFGVSSLMLYRYQRIDDFAYRISQIIPYPVARVDGNFVSYEEYLFEVRQNVHFYTTQENINFDDEEGQAILANVRNEALQRVKENAIARKLAEANAISVTPEEVSEQIATIREQGGIGDSDEALENTLNQYYNWTLEDFQDVIQLQLLKQKLISVLDSSATARITSIQNQINDGGSFAELAETESDDPFSKENGGRLGAINRANTDFPAIFTETAFALGEGQVSDVVQTSVGLHLIKNLGADTDVEDQIEVAHILIRFNDIDSLLRNELADVEVTDYVALEEVAGAEGGGQSQPQIDDLR